MIINAGELNHSADLFHQGNCLERYVNRTGQWKCIFFSVEGGALREEKDGCEEGEGHSSLHSKIRFLLIEAAVFAHQTPTAAAAETYGGRFRDDALDGSVSIVQWLHQLLLTLRSLKYRISDCVHFCKFSSRDTS